jgi:hypothetical protein
VDYADVGHIGAMAKDWPPASFWEDYARRIQADLEQTRKDLAPLESGQMRIGSRTGDGPWRDKTGDWIAHFKRTIATFEDILAAVKKKKTP